MTLQGLVTFSRNPAFLLSSKRTALVRILKFVPSLYSTPEMEDGIEDTLLTSPNAMGRLRVLALQANTACPATRWLRRSWNPQFRGD